MKLTCAECNSKFLKIVIYEEVTKTYKRKYHNREIVCCDCGNTVICLMADWQVRRYRMKGLPLEIREWEG